MLTLPQICPCTKMDTQSCPQKALQGRGQSQGLLSLGNISVLHVVWNDLQNLGAPQRKIKFTVE